MSDYRNYDCFTCQHWYNCGKEEVMLNYKFNRSGSCHAYSPESGYHPIEQQARVEDFEKHIKWLENNRIPRQLW